MKPLHTLTDIDELKLLLRYEVLERFEEGFTVDVEDYTMRISDANSIDMLMDIYFELESCKPRNTYSYIEPTDWSSIRGERPGFFEEYPIPMDSIPDKILGGWLGRCAGCMLGKPVEGWTHSQIKHALSRIGEYPLKTPYIPFEAFSEVDEKKRRSVSRLTRGNIVMAERDDDIDYTIINLLIYERYRSAFDSIDIGEMWLLHLPYKSVYTAERAAYRNLVIGLKPPTTATYLNPYREWIGAQIRADFWGYISPGKPEQALSYAFKDSILSHTKNGIYGELYVTSLVSLAFYHKSTIDLVSEGLKSIPSKSRLSEALRFVLDLYRKGLSWFEALDQILIRYGGYHPVHTINNAAIVTASLLWGEGDFARTLCYALLSGLDTDCNCATVGSILGVMLGRKGIPEGWIQPLNDMVASAVSGIGVTSISGLAERTIKLIRGL
ncbi:MAG: ADP-ribosylglycohydrolase family protein [Nitrososphaerota archaeon]|nr:ADP-ribosylglycohydrolase family protein [Candidatus Bathyarchaeota archaeon]MDW8061079.1 ADP-ribosylglycohydrolase family protein [Nitrososphaerota archaeon]